MTKYLYHSLTLAAAVCAAAIFATSAQADPLPGQILKFDQEPMIATPLVGHIYYGHDELSTAYGVSTAASPPVNYRGTFMADDFADKFTTPVVHITWWGSYLNDPVPAAQPKVQKFLIAWETDVPALPGTFSHPGSVIQHEVVTPGTLSPGTFTETLERGPDPVLGESLYRYNAQLALPFNQAPDTVYWLKIAALVDLPQPLPIGQPIPPGVTQWGWHNRDYTINDPQASTIPNVNPGEFIDGNVPGTNIPIWHFQDDAVTGILDYTPVTPNGGLINQFNMTPANYQFVNTTGVGPIDGPAGIELKSKDLAFRLYTTIPEPTACVLMAIGLAGVFASARRSRTA